ncbi:MAG: phenylpropionate dioxygenase [Rubrivivax sp.]|nr:phenylpropionate dioxygenase [Rubrivivax sp.]
MTTLADVTPEQLRAFVSHEARLLDEQRLEEWNALFAPGGWYWLPASPACTDPLREASHLYDDDLLRRVKIARLVHPAAHSQQPRGRCHRLLQESDVLQRDATGNRFELRTPFIYTELRASRTVMLPGVAWHQLVVHQGALRIALKRVDLLHADEALPAIEFYV